MFKDPAALKGVSIIICTFNGKERLLPTLHGILGLKADLPWELVIVDNASTDGTTAFCNEVLAGAEIDWSIITEKEPGLNHARLAGMRSSRYGILLFCDDDNILAPDYLSVGYRIMEANASIGVLGGRGEAVLEEVRPDWFDKYSHSFAVGAQAVVDGMMSKRPSAVYGAGAFFRKEPLEQFFSNGFRMVMSDRKGKSLASGGDVELCYLVQLKGFEVWYNGALNFRHMLPKGRINWHYYLRLKQSIAYGGAYLNAYSILIRNRNAGAIDFWSTWCKGLITSSLLVLKNGLRRGRATDGDTLALARVVAKARARAYWTNGLQAYAHFKQLKEVL